MRLRGFGWLVLMFVGLWLTGCGSDQYGMASQQGDSTTAGEGGPVAPRGCQLPIGRSTVQVEGVPVDLLMPDGDYRGDLLVLPPWNVGREDWCLHARFCAKAVKRGYRLIMPEMGKSIYAHAVYPETRHDWRDFPTIQWVKERLIPDLRNNYCLLQEDGYNFVIGASSGARGAILLAEEMPSLFVAVAALSGDYNPADMKGDNIYRGFLGEYEEFSQRWETAENVLEGSSQIKSAVYLGHGKADKMVPYAQTVKLYDLLKTQTPDLNLHLNLPPDGGNNFTYWASETTSILDFFENTQASGPEGAM